jgi:hypothetical protein
VFAAEISRLAEFEKAAAEGVPVESVKDDRWFRLAVAAGPICRATGFTS